MTTPETRPSITAEARLNDRLEILELTGRLGLLVDAREWSMLEQLFTDPVDIDYTSLNGGEPSQITPSVLIGGWQAVLDQLQATQHLIANQVIAFDASDEATCAANVIGTHVLPNMAGGPIWTVGGRYDYGLHRTPDGWRIAALTLTVQWATGNQHIMQLAAAGAPSA
jgi:SnoaL-like domain